VVANKGLVRLHQSYESSTDLISDMANLAKLQGLVDDSYLVAILEREKNYPTGLELPVSIAIPHIDTGVKKIIRQCRDLTGAGCFLQYGRFRL